MRTATWMTGALVALVLGAIAGPLVGPLCAEEPSAETFGVLKKVGVRRGICVVLGDAKSERVLDLARASELLVYVQSPDAATVEAVRRSADAAGLLGSRVYVEKGAWSRIHLARNLADAAVVAGDALGDGGVPRAELLRILRPGGKALLGKKEIIKPVPVGIDEWTHPYHGPDNNPQSKDKGARGPYLTHFLAEPWYCPMPEMTVASGGRLFKAFGNRTSKQPQWPWVNTLVALNGYNGTLLWKRDLSPGFMIHRNTLIATPTTVYLGDDKSCKVLDAATGKLIDEINAPEGLSDGPVWKWMALADGVLYALVGEKEPKVTTIRRGGFRGAGWPWWKINDYPFGFGRTLLAIDTRTKKVLWHHREKAKLDGRAMCMAAGRIFFYSDQKFLGCLDARKGKILWKTSDADVLNAIGAHSGAQNPFYGFLSSSYVKCSGKALFFAGPMRNNLLAVSATTGKLLWQRPGGNYQLVLRDDALYALGGGRRNESTSSLKLAPLTGEILAKFASRDRCTRATGCVDAIFTRGGRGGSTAVFEVGKEKPTIRVLSPMRPACQDGVVVAHGQLYWGPWMCRCDLTQIGVICLEPAAPFKDAPGATEEDPLELPADPAGKITPLAVSDEDWPTYRRDNIRSNRSPVAIPARIDKTWEFKPTGSPVATAPVAVGGLVFVSGSDGTVRALDSGSGKLRWTVYTGGPVKYPPSIAEGRAYVGSGDGRVYCLEAATGKRLWRFRAAPAERKVMIFGSLTSTWAAASGVLVEDGKAYVAAGTFNYNGTHVYALDAVTGKTLWHNSTSADPTEKGGPPGAGVQGHLLLHRGRLYLAGGSTSPATSYDLATGEHKRDGGTGGGKDLYVTGGGVRSDGVPLYWRPEDSHFISKMSWQTPAGTLAVSGASVTLRGKNTWSVSPFQDVNAIAMAKNAVVVAGTTRRQVGDRTLTSGGLCAYDLSDGKLLWKQPLPAPAVSFGLALERSGKIVVSLQNGMVVCYGSAS